MNNRALLDSIRSASNYPAFRGFVTVAATVGYLAAVMLAFVGVYALLQGAGGIVGGASFLIAGLLLALVVKAAVEMSLMLADIADCTVASLAPASQQAVPHQPSTTTLPPAADNRSEAELMAEHGIALEGGQYVFQGYRYDRLADAIAYAKRQRRGCSLPDCLPAT